MLYSIPGGITITKAKPKPRRKWWPWSRQKDAMTIFHEAWNYAHEHPSEISGGYDKAAFAHVHFWLQKVSG